jgi:DNA-binding helix-hairpin-helix protein with protein kinase domain
MMVQSQSFYTIGESPIFNGTGGEGAVYEVKEDPSLLYKKYNPGRLNAMLIEKLNYMIQKPINVSDPNSSFAWPRNIIQENGQNKGFIMPRLNFNCKIDDIYAYRQSAAQPAATHQNRVLVARNLCVMVGFAEQNHIVIGDFNHGNIGIDGKTGLVSMMDCDSFHLCNGKYRCTVCMTGYTAPEMLKRLREGSTNDYARADLPTFTYETDRFALAVHIFRLLMNGVSPYNGIDTSIKSSSATLSEEDEAIEKGKYCFRLLHKPKSPLCPPMHILPNVFRDYFHRAFIGDPGQRPAPAEWIKILDAYKSMMARCPQNNMHWHHHGLTCCPWCEADERQKAVNEHRPKPRFAVKRRPGKEQCF